MSSVRILLLTGVATAALVAGARAADLPPILQHAPPVPVEAFGGWYLRGDIGMSNQNVDRAVFDFGTLPQPTQVRRLQAGFDSAPIFGLGLGYQFNSWLRGDITGEYRGKSSFSAYEIVTSGGATFSENNTAKKSEWVALANVYVDLGTWWCLTPFVGAGVGVSYNRISDFQDINVITNGHNFAPDAGKWNLAWALHAGVAYKVTPGFTVELAYRYLNLGDASTGGPITGWDGTYQGAGYRFYDIDSHDLKVGMRWMLNSPPVVAPLMTKG